MQRDGQAEPALQRKLIATYLKLLDEYNRLPSVMCFYTERVKLAVTRSPVLDALHSLLKTRDVRRLRRTSLVLYVLGLKDSNLRIQIQSLLSYH